MKSHGCIFCIHDHVGLLVTDYVVAYLDLSSDGEVDYRYAQSTSSLSLTSMNKVPTANGTCACKSLLKADLSDRSCLRGESVGTQVCYFSVGATLPPCSFLLEGRTNLKSMVLLFESHSTLAFTLFYYSYN